MSRYGEKALLLAAGLLGIGCSDGTGPGNGDPTGNRIAFIADGNVASMREDGSNQVLLTKKSSNSSDYRFPTLQWSPDGTRLLGMVETGQPGGTIYEIIVTAADGSGSRSITWWWSGWGLGLGSWSSDGTRITYWKSENSHMCCMAIYTINADGNGGEAPLKTDTLSSHFGFYSDWIPIWSPDGQEIAFESGRDTPTADYSFQWHLFVSSASGSPARQLFPGGAFGFAWAPDSRHLAVVEGEYPAGNIFVVDREGGSSVRLSSQDNVDVAPVWSPDGSRLAFRSIRDGNLELYVMNADGSGVQRLTNDPAEDTAPAWSPDGTRLAFQTNRDGNWEIYTIGADGTGLANLTRSPGRETTPAWR
jgi:Tol biopolymer transport system component